MMTHYLKQKNLQASALITALLLQPSTSFAQDAEDSIGCTNTTSNLGEVAAELSCETGSLPMLFSGASYVMGVGFTIAGLMKMKEYVDDPSRAFMKDALIRLGVGALLILLPFVIDASAKTFGGTAGGDYGRQSLVAF